MERLKVILYDKDEKMKPSDYEKADIVLKFTTKNYIETKKCRYIFENDVFLNKIKKILEKDQ